MRFTIPNLLSLLRMGLIPVFVITVVNGDLRKALLVFLVAGVTDALDGAIARFWHQESPLGAYLDPIADKLVLVIARDVLLVVVGLVLYLAAGVRSFPPTILSKVNTIFQVLAVGLVLVSASFPTLRWIELTSETCLFVVAGLTLASGLDYVYRASRLEKPAAK